MKTFIGKIAKRQTGAVLMEMLLVMPLYLLIFGGVFYLGECVLKNNRVLQGGCTFGYLALHSSAHDAFKNAMERFLLSDDNGELQWTARFMSKEPASLITQTSWSGILSSYTTLTDVPLPDFIDGMLKMGEHFYNPDNAEDEDLTMHFGTLQDDDLSLRHWLVARQMKVPDSRPSMGNVVTSWDYPKSENNEVDDKKCRYYTEAKNYVYEAQMAISDNWLLDEKTQSTDWFSGVQQDASGENPLISDFYLRLYGTFFSEGAN